MKFLIPLLVIYFGIGHVLAVSSIPDGLHCKFAWRMYFRNWERAIIWPYHVFVK